MRALVLNKHWIPVNVIGLEAAFTMLFKGRAYCLDHVNYVQYGVDDWIKLSCSMALPKIRTTRYEIATPEVLILKDYHGVPARRIKYSKTNVMYRDKFVCQYCGKRFSKEDLNIDHVVPKCKGGLSVWTNVVASCVDCNRRKDDRTPEEAGMRLLKQPKEPIGTNPMFCLNREDTVRDSWKKFLFVH